MSSRGSVISSHSTIGTTSNISSANSRGGSTVGTTSARLLRSSSTGSQSNKNKGKHNKNNKGGKNAAGGVDADDDDMLDQEEGFYGVPEQAPDETMSGEERMFHVYENFTDIEHALERARHFLNAINISAAATDSTSSSTSAINNEIEAVLDRVRSALPKLWGNHMKLPKKVSSKAAEPTHNRERFVECQELSTLVKDIVKKAEKFYKKNKNAANKNNTNNADDALSSINADEQDGNLEDGLLASMQEFDSSSTSKNSLLPPVTPSNPIGSLLFKVLESINVALDDSIQLLDSNGAWKNLPTRKYNCEEEVMKLTSHFVTDFNNLVSTQLPLMLHEAEIEGATFFTFPVRSTGAVAAATAGNRNSNNNSNSNHRVPQQHVGLVPIDVAVGTYPVRNVNAALMNASRQIEMILKRVGDESRILNDLAKRDLNLNHGNNNASDSAAVTSSASAGGTSEKDRYRRKLLIEQRETVERVKSVITEYQQELFRLANEWREIEEDFLQRGLKQHQTLSSQQQQHHQHQDPNNNFDGTSPSNNNANSNTNVNEEHYRTLVELKSLKQANIARALTALMKEVLSASYPFISPQYCRRRSLSYTNPCLVRFAVRIVSMSSQPVPEAVTIKSFHPASQLNNFPEELVPGSCNLVGENSSGNQQLSGNKNNKNNTSTGNTNTNNADAAGENNSENAASLFHQNEIWMPFDQFPEIVCGDRCALKGEGSFQTTVKRSVALDEQRECGGYFIAGGNERILRMLQVQRSNLAINIERSRFSAAGFNFLTRAVVFRSRRESGLTTANILYGTRSGDCVFTFTRKTPWNIPVTLLLFACKQVTAAELIATLSLGADDESKHRAEVLLQHHLSKPYGTYTSPLQFLALLGKMYCNYQFQRGAGAVRFLPETGVTIGPNGVGDVEAQKMQKRIHHDAWYGLYVLRRHVLPHLNVDVPTPDCLNSPANNQNLRHWPGPAIQQELSAKFDAIIEMVRQLHSFVSGKSCHQGNDAPSFHEVFSPSQLLVAAFETCVFRAARGASYRIASVLTPNVITDLFHIKRQVNSNKNSNYLALSSDAASTGSSITLHDVSRPLDRLRNYANHVLGLAPSEGLLDNIHRILTTGNFTLDRDEDFFTPQSAGWSVMVEHLNFYRFFEQLRTIHRGSKIAEMRSAEVRKYPSDAFGFMCMVHSPDGTDCGVVNYLTTSAEISNPPAETLNRRILNLIANNEPSFSPVDAPSGRLESPVPVWLEGRVVGFLSLEGARRIERAIRQLKLIDTDAKTGATKKMPDLGLIEVVLCANTAPVDNTKVLANVDCPTVGVEQKQPLGLYIFTGPGRLLRTVRHVRTGKELKVGTWEQMWIDIAGVPSDISDGIRDVGRAFEYIERSGADLISFTSNTIPFFEHNCSPRNLFQCGLSKQTCGTQVQSQGWRKDAKLFRMMSPQKYLVRTRTMDKMGLDDFSLGVNAVVAVLSYTGYDMDDAVIVNRSAIERGFLNAHITIAKVIPDNKHAKDHGPPSDKSRREDGVLVFNNLNAQRRKHCVELEENGLPSKRALAYLAAGGVASTTLDGSGPRDHSQPSLLDDTPICCTARRFERRDPITGQVRYEYVKHHVKRWRDLDKGEAGWVHNIIPLAYDGPDVTQALFVFRIPRNPQVGDKFSSRHGQKGTLPLLIPHYDLPFAANGMVPDVIINPHAFPSRMTVGMILELVAGKLSAARGRFFDNSAWSLVDETPMAANELAGALADAGLQWHGRETLYCGASGEQMETDVYMGVCGYQRLRHMVSDKWQARAQTDSHTHRAVTRTGQPVKGRKRHGGVRVGEMERDGLLSHGVTEVILDRFMHVSDQTKAFLCTRCGGMTTVYESNSTDLNTTKLCTFCDGHDPHAVLNPRESDASIVLIDIPQVLRLFVNELAGIGVRVSFRLRDEDSTGAGGKKQQNGISGVAVIVGEDGASP